MRRIAGEALETSVAALFEAVGVGAADARTVARLLARANLEGHDSHGVILAPRYVEMIQEGLIDPAARLRALRDQGSILVFDAGRGFGQLMAARALDRGCARAKEQGCAVVALQNSAHVGRVGEWGERCARAGLASIHLVNVTDHDPRVAPHGGSDARLSTNPICMAVPGADDPARHGAATLLDMATSEIALGKARVAHNKGEPAPEGALIDARGAPTTDPAGLIERGEGALKTFGGHKGSGLAMMIELFAGALIGGPTLAPHHPRKGGIVNNMLSILLDPAAFGDVERFMAEAAAAKAHVLASPPPSGAPPPMAPGDPEARAFMERSAHGTPLDATTLADLIACGERLGVADAMRALKEAA